MGWLACAAGAGALDGSSLMRPPRVFLSSSHNFEGHRAQDLALANRLGGNGKANTSGRIAADLVPVPSKPAATRMYAQDLAAQERPGSYV